MTGALPIGLFDSGVGGLTVLAAMQRRMPRENMLYLGDTARLPYGTKSPDTITRYALQATSWLVKQRIKLLVIACNTVTAAALPVLRRHFMPLPVIGVVEPGAIAAVEGSRKRHVAVIATEATIGRGAYQESLQRLSPGMRITSRPCSLLVSLAEEGWLDGEECESVVARYLNPIFKSRDAPDCLLLGCTHFPLLLGPIRKVLGPDVRIVDSAETTARRVLDELSSAKLQRTNRGKATIRFFTTDDPERFARTGSLFLGNALPVKAVQLVDL